MRCSLYALIFFCCLLVPRDGFGGIVPDNLCSDLKAVAPETLEWISGRHPIAQSARVVEMPMIITNQIMERAAAAGISTTALFTDDAWLESCYFYVSSDTLLAIDKKFDLDLVLPLAGKDIAGYPFRIYAFVLGFREHIMIYDRNAPIVYYNERYKRTFRVAMPMVTKIMRRNSIALSDIEILDYMFPVRLEKIELHNHNARALASAGFFSLWHDVPWVPIRIRAEQEKSK